MTCAVLREVGLTPIVPDGGYFVLVDTSAVGKDFETTSPGQEAYPICNFFAIQEVHAAPT